MKVLMVNDWNGHKANTLIDTDGMSIATRRRLFTLGFLMLPTTQRLREAAQARAIKGWHNMKHETLMERLVEVPDGDN